ncbi:1,4-alpha-glucan branching protein domain-containing protein [Exiguobacterium sp. SRB7LM]|uniref:1,4-alpha-glucan branching protein domain-containing protein n=1 Tax=Exiguobacterium sp. SRB7LM TaxID=2608401 RepID=UPI0018C3E2AD|nr:1,4-alpha-glucan branching protein domain-containing protein [Exiguobacterium sp. SRB7LM]MBG0917331.1 DUF1957 domain-containing protein [Exiguobacterium sp. SRB7LM]
MKPGYFSLVLHAHLPYVRHEEKHRLEERWVYEAISETYLPILWQVDRLKRPLHWTVSISPPVVEMLADPLIQDRYVEHLDDMLELIALELSEDRTDEETATLHFYRQRYHDLKNTFLHWNKNLNEAFRTYREAGYIDMVTCTATHGFNPHLFTEQAARAEIRTGLNCFERHYGFRPTGIWLPECAYTPGVDRILYEEGIRYTFVDEHALLDADPTPEKGIGAPVYSPHGVALFPRDQIISGKIWSSMIGYPGHPDYREFYRDLAYDRDWDYIQSFMHPEGIRFDTGLKMHRITGDTDQKDFYVREWAEHQIENHATDFAKTLESHLEAHGAQTFPPFLVTAPFDAELFGHWWFEGPEFLGKVAERLAEFGIETITPALFLERHFKDLQTVHVSMNTWGRKGYGEVWINERNEWMLRHLHMMEMQLVKDVADYRNQSEATNRALKQLIRHYVLAVSSDWAFILDGQTTAQYAAERFREHTRLFAELETALYQDGVSEQLLHDHYAAYPFLQDEDIDIDSFLSPHDYYVTIEREGEKSAILVLTPEYHGHIVWGLGRRVVDEIEARADDGEVVYVLTPYHDELPEYERQGNIHVYRVRPTSPFLEHVMNQVATQNIAYVKLVHELSKRVSFKVIHHFDWMTIPAARELAQSLAIPLYSTMLSFEATRNPHGHGGLFDAIHRIENSVFSASERVYVGEEISIHDLKQWYNVSENVNTCLPLETSPYGQESMKKNVK